MATQDDEPRSRRPTQAQVREAVRVLTTPSATDADRSAAMSTAIAVLQIAARSSIDDECQQEVPYQPMHQVREGDGKVYLICEHDPPHKTHIHG